LCIFSIDVTAMTSGSSKYPNMFFSECELTKESESSIVTNSELVLFIPAFIAAPFPLFFGKWIYFTPLDAKLFAIFSVLSVEPSFITVTVNLFGSLFETGKFLIVFLFL